MNRISIGAKGEEKLLVTREVCIGFLGSEDGRVLSTPHMIGYMERTCRNLVLPMLESGHDTVGTKVNVSHLAAAPLGANVVFTAEIVSATDRRVQFRVEARDGKDLIGEGALERAIIDVAKFSSRLAEKKQQS